MCRCLSQRCLFQMYPRGCRGKISSFLSSSRQNPPFHDKNSVVDRHPYLFCRHICYCEVLRCISLAIVVRKAWVSLSRMNPSAEFSSPSRMRALPKDPVIKYCLCTPSTPRQRTQMYFDNKASKHDSAHDKFSCVYLNPSDGKDMSTQRHSETRCYPLLPPLMRGLYAGSKRSSLQAVPLGLKGLQRFRMVLWG